MSVTQNGLVSVAMNHTADVKRNGSDVTQNDLVLSLNDKASDVKRYGDRAIKRSRLYVVELSVVKYLDEPRETPWYDRVERLWSRTVQVTRESFHTEYDEAWNERRESLKSNLLRGSSYQRVDGEWTHYSRMVVPCWGCDELVLIETSRRLGQYCSDQCRDDRYRREQAESKRRQRAELRGERCCDHCGETYEPKRSGSKFCSTRCRVAASRAAKIGGGE